MKKIKRYTIKWFKGNYSTDPDLIDFWTNSTIVHPKPKKRKKK